MTTAVEVAEKGHQLAAWVNFDGTLAMTVGSSYGPDAPPADYSSPNPIRAAYNVDYIIDRGTGDYEIHFATALPDANYCIAGTAGKAGGNAAMGHDTNTAMSTSAVRIVTTRTTDGAKRDTDPVFLSIFR